MLRTCVIFGALIVAASCSKSDGSDSIGNALLAGGPEAGAGSSGSGAKAGSAAAGSNATAMAGSGAKLGSAAGSNAMAGSAAGAAAKPADAPKAGSGAGSDTAKAGSAVAAVAKPAEPVKPADATKPSDPPKAGSNAAMTGSAAVATKPDAAKPVATKPDAAKPVATKPDAAKPDVAKPVATKPDAAKPDAAKPVAAVTPRPVTATPAELAAIKLSLLPNWDRDIDGPGTFQYVVRIKGTKSTKTFTFHYGYDDAAAPVDRDQYQKYLQDTKLLTGKLKDRQRGAAWFLEGNDETGLPAFRYQVLYGGKRLICYGSLYKDADSNRLGDDRDQTVIQAKQICETLAL
jgi:hypothetical protein